MTRASDGNTPDGDAPDRSGVPNLDGADLLGSTFAENFDAFALPKGHALAEAIDEIALRLAIPREHAREIARRAIATLRDEAARRGLPLDDLMARWTES